MSRIYGSNQPKFQGTGTPDSTERNLDYVVKQGDNATIDDIVEQKAPAAASGDRDFISFGFYSEFSYIVYLDEYPDADTQFDLLQTYRYQDVYFAPHREKGYLQSKTGGNALFTVTTVSPISLDDYGDRNACLITFKSKPYTSLL